MTDDGSSSDPSIRGFIASVDKPGSLNIYDTGEHAGVDLFVNGRLRERDILSRFSFARIAVRYLYGQIHFDKLDSDDVDPFTSNREGVVEGNVVFGDFLKELRSTAWAIIEKWDDLLLANN